ncbi:nitrate- and nitrite sensing domain-containing protein [Actinomadura sp. BRA 177]|uniref:nitrate- and nitrite sensing domain-containing protein n=1 Tax=Actinomadura sp. BRA 177 TaxID=2745202 RepID=UPI00159579DC|nr:nitrate- and nitrite sensing domain-containing protein [Actinomadura sp. BRA 177]NVI90176.1 nitrate- and nitrite sensing domain-containing protein [Actinomadura sp. BRA 177]
MRTPRRRRSIRFSLFGLIIIPLISLITLWAFAAQSTAAKAVNQRDLDTTNEIYGGAAQPMLVTLAQERQESVTWLSRTGRLPRTSLDAVRKKMDGTIVQMNEAVDSDRFQATLTGPMKRRLSALMEKLNGISALRSQVDSRALTRLAAFNAYNDVLEAHFQYVNVLVAGDGLQQSAHMAAMSRGIELRGREIALVGGVLTDGGRMTAGEYAAVSRLVYERRFLESSNLAELHPAIAAPFKQALASSAERSFTTMEDGILATRPGAKLQITPVGWKAAAGASIGAVDGALGKSRALNAAEAKDASDATLLRLALIGAIGLAAIVLTAFLMLRFSRRISRDLRGLQDAAHAMAEERLPDVVRRLSRGDEVDVAAEAPPLEAGRTAEVFNVAAAFSSVQHTAVEAAVGQAELRAAVNQVFQNLARRNQSLLHRQLAMLDTLERKASDPDALADLFAIDHLTTRMRRHAEGLIILSGAAPGRGWRHPVGILDVLRGAIGEIEDYARVEVVSTAEEGIVGSAVADVIHLLAELIENAAVLSPPNTPVEVDAGPVGQGFVVEIQDRGLGMSPDKLAAVNAQLSREPEFDLTHGDQLGLFVVGTLAHRRGIKVALEPNAYGGLKTVVLLPHSLVVPVDRGGRADDTGTGPVDVIGHDTQEYAMDSVGRHRAGGTEPSGDREPLGMPSSSEPPSEPGVQAAPATPQPTSTIAGTHAGMPRRVRRANLAPQLRDAPPSAPEERRPAGREARSAERASSVMASMQSGWRRGRSESPPAQPTGRDEGDER